MPRKPSPEQLGFTFSIADSGERITVPSHLSEIAWGNMIMSYLAKNALFKERVKSSKKVLIFEATDDKGLKKSVYDPYNWQKIDEMPNSNLTNYDMVILVADGLLSLQEIADIVGKILEKKELNQNGGSVFIFEKNSNLSPPRNT